MSSHTSFRLGGPADLYVTPQNAEQAARVFGLLNEQEVPTFILGAGANILVFSTLSAANAAYKLMGQIGGAEVIGPVLLGMARPVHLLQRGSTTQDVFNLATIASVDAQNSGG